MGSGNAVHLIYLHLLAQVRRDMIGAAGAGETVQHHLRQRRRELLLVASLRGVAVSELVASTGMTEDEVVEIVA